MLDVITIILQNYYVFKFITITMRNFKAKFTVLIVFVLSCGNIQAQIDGPPPPPPVAPINDWMLLLTVVALILGASVLLQNRKFNSK